MTSPTISPPQVAAPVAAATVLERHRDTNSPGVIRPFPSMVEFIEEAEAQFANAEPIPPPPKAPLTDFLNPPNINLHRPPSSSPLESEAEEEQENSRLVSMDDFLTQDQEPDYCRTQQVSSDFCQHCLLKIVYLSLKEGTVTKGCGI